VSISTTNNLPNTTYSLALKYTKMAITSQLQHSVFGAYLYIYTAQRHNLTNFQILTKQLSNTTTEGNRSPTWNMTIVWLNPMNPLPTAGLRFWSGNYYYFLNSDTWIKLLLQEKRLALVHIINLFQWGDSTVTICERNITLFPVWTGTTKGILPWGIYVWCHV